MKNPLKKQQKTQSPNIIKSKDQSLINQIADILYVDDNTSEYHEQNAMEELLQN